MGHSSACVSDLFLDHRETLVHTLFRMEGCRQTAEDLAQEAYVRVMGAAESQHVTYLKAFLYQTARNLALDHLRKAKVRSRTGCPEADPEIVAEIPASLRHRSSMPQRSRMSKGCSKPWLAYPSVGG